jgi:coproporphyrinogen III oxidase-like Fe-S oxidoreductase
LKLRTAEGISDIAKYSEVLVNNYESLLMDFQKAGLVSFDGTKLNLTDSGMDVSNSIITDLLTNL